METGKKKCEYFKCEEIAHFAGSEEKPYYYRFCEHHQKGGIFGTGRTFEQYSIIEEDFITFLKYVPLTEEHFDVHSPFLRDIIIRTCVQIELFFKEWGKAECTDSPNHPLAARYLKNEREIKFHEFLCFKDEFSKFRRVYVLPLDEAILPFEGWTNERDSLWWWGIYNGLKHGREVKPIFKAALYSLAALFLMHAVQIDSKKYLTKLVHPNIEASSFGKLTLSTKELRTPVDSRKYLFRTANFSGADYDLITRQEVREEIRGI